MELAELETARLVLRRVDPVRDAEDLAGLDGDPAVYEHAGRHTEGTAAERMRRRLRTDLEGNGGATWALRRRGEAAALGTIGLFAGPESPIRGMSWALLAAHRRQGLMGEAAAAVVPWLLAQPGVAGLEAWIDSTNLASLGVARRAGMEERARLPRTYDDRIAQTIVMAIAARREDPVVFSIAPVLAVRDVDATATLLRDLLDLRVAWSAGEPRTRVAQLAHAPWSGSPGLQLRAADGPIDPAELAVETGVRVDDVHARALAAGLEVREPPGNRPWYRRDFTLRLPEGHRLTVSGPVTPGWVTGA